MQHTTTQSLWDAVGGLSNASKMPGWSYGLPAAECKVGSLLRKVKGSTCSGCYAMKGRYGMPNVQEAQYRRLDLLTKSPIEWGDAMVELLRRKYANKSGADRVFRWHDSGDLQGFWHLALIVGIATSLPDIQFWLPTREAALVRQFTRITPFPPNLVVRVSAAMVNGKVPDFEHTSGVDDPSGFQCPAPDQGGKCGDCRACWSPDVSHVSYHKH